MSLCTTCEKVVFGRIDKTAGYNQALILLKDLDTNSVEAELYFDASNTVMNANGDYLTPGGILALELSGPDMGWNSWGTSYPSLFALFVDDTTSSVWLLAVRKL